MKARTEWGLLRPNEAGVLQFKKYYLLQLYFCGNMFPDHKAIGEFFLDQPRFASGDGESAFGFQRRVSPANPRLIESVCAGCNSFVAASRNPALLDLAEKIHTCAGLKRISPLSGISVP